MGGVATIEEYEDSPYLLSQVVRSVEGFEGRHPLWVEHDPQGGCTLRLHLSDMKRHITGNFLCGPILNDPRCVACIARCPCPCSCYEPPRVSASRQMRKRD